MSTTETYRLALTADRTTPALTPPSKFTEKFDIYNNCHISYGLPFHQAVAKHVESTFHASRVYVMVSRTLATGSTALQDLKDALGDKLVGVKMGLKAHTSWNDLLEMTLECVELKADLIVTAVPEILTYLRRNWREFEYSETPVADLYIACFEAVTAEKAVGWYGHSGYIE
ncbi:Fe-containing alcohol dehydrogenase [Mycena chlorophos]|uniref:Fe-containing alcohol dehydrogenase n=1 Tax=Mycena chlorophos TaxID=658473 RepID=A0A8H6SJ12_MYCCL|nr:Fe-containing alcohol dehydrogenase [Mycena chlorophos]